MSERVHVTGKERFFDAEDIIVSKTDTSGRILYANDVFLAIAGFTEQEVLGQPHSIIRHPDMPRCVFKLLWDTIAQGDEIFAYVVNRCRNGDHYWVFAHVTPTLGENGQIVSYHSSRRVPRREALNAIQPLYATLLAEERRHANRKEGLEASWARLHGVLRERGVRYDEFIFSLETAA